VEAVVGSPDIDRRLQHIQLPGTQGPQQDVPGLRKEDGLHSARLPVSTAEAGVGSRRHRIQVHRQ
jgi:hypothetical protein